MNTKNILLIFTLSIALFACDLPLKDKSDSGSTSEDSTMIENQNLSEAEKFVKSIEKAHHKLEFSQKEVVQFDIHLLFSGKSRFNGTVSMTPNGEFVKMEDSSKTIIWDGKQVYLSPDTASSKGARFAVLTWSYFFAAPYKFSDSGAKMELKGDKQLVVEASDGDSANSQKYRYNAGRLTFDQGVGDSPDDWYMVYQDKESDLLACLAYVVTYGKSIEKAEKDPHAITYEAYTNIDGIPMATQWNFWTWNQDGELKKLLGEAMLSNIKFVKKTDDLFKPSVNAKLVEKPRV